MESDLHGGEWGLSSGGAYQVQLPARLKPNRGPNFAFIAAFLAFIGFIAFHYAGLGPEAFGFSIDFSAVKSSSPTESPLARGPLTPWLAGSAIAAVLFFCIWREIAYFRAGGSYFLGLSPAGVTVSSPLVLREFAWDEIERFRVLAKHRRRRYGGRRTTYSVRADRRAGGWFASGVNISQADFAKDLGVDNAQSAEILCAFLNEVRDRVREAERAGAIATIPVPHGLHVSEWRPSPGREEPPQAAPDKERAERRARQSTIIRE